MRKQQLILILLLVGCFSLATWLQPTQAAHDERMGRSEGFLALLFGDGRKFFSEQVFEKADAYFHRGNYPSIFDREVRKEENHMTEASHDEHDHEHGDHHDDEVLEGPPPAHDWIETLNQKFHASAHAHLESGTEREMLPWLKLSAELDPHNVEAYTVTAYWLRERLKKVDDAEQFLREGLRQNPNDPDILNELARLNFENRRDFARARNLWVMALRSWNQMEQPKKEPDFLLHLRILAGLVQSEIALGETDRAIDYLKLLKEVSPNPDEIQKRIDELKANGTLDFPK